jgi:hypothetical protein
MRMRSILVVLLVVTIPSSASDPSPEAAVLARLLDTEREAVRRELRAVLAASADGAAVLDRIAPLVKTDRGRDLVAAILVDLRTAARKDPASAERLLGARLSAETLWRLGLGSGGGGEVVLFFDARTFARVERGIERLSTLEYLVCPAPPAGGPPAATSASRVSKPRSGRRSAPATGPAARSPCAGAPRTARSPGSRSRMRFPGRGPARSTARG